MYTEINESEFIRQFRNMRPESFSIPGLRALFDYLTDMEEQLGEAMELDVIAICYDWSEMTEEEIRWEYDHIDGISEAEDLAELAEALNKETTIIETANDTFIVLAF